jgi:DME family drug/metabolite transporter
LGLVPRRERPSRRWALATALAVVGAALLVLAGGVGGDVDPAGVALGLGAGASYALYTVPSKAMLEAGHRPEGVMALRSSREPGRMRLPSVLYLGGRSRHA